MGRKPHNNCLMLVSCAPKLNWQRKMAEYITVDVSTVTETRTHSSRMCTTRFSGYRVRGIRGRVCYEWREGVWSEWRGLVHEWGGQVPKKGEGVSHPLHPLDLPLVAILSFRLTNSYIDEWWTFRYLIFFQIVLDIVRIVQWTRRDCAIRVKWSANHNWTFWWDRWWLISRDFSPNYIFSVNYHKLLQKMK